MSGDMIHSGCIDSKNYKHFAYDFNNGEFIVHLHEKMPDLEGQNYIKVKTYSGKNYLLYAQLPLDTLDFPIYPQNYKYEIDWAISGYMTNSKYREMVFSFDELQYFCPARDFVKKEGNILLFPLEVAEKNKFNVLIDGVLCRVTFRTAPKLKISSVKFIAETITEISICFDETDDFHFIADVYSVVDSVFSFICNRRNICCTDVNLIGEYPDLDSEGEKNMCSNRMIFFHKYREKPETTDIIQKVAGAKLLFKHIDKLFEAIAEGISSEGGEEGKISISSIHSSQKRKRLIDLEQSLSITSAFEFYVRKYLPEMKKEEEYHKKVEEALNKLAEENTGKAKKLIKSLIKKISTEPALKDKIKKVYEGYADWIGLKECINMKWFDEIDVDILSEEINTWRNELAHEKREYTPNKDTITAVRFLEHLNYAIVLRSIGYEDNEIKEILQNILEK